MEWLTSWDPFEIGGEAVDGGAGTALRWDDFVPVLVYYAAPAGHVALAGENEDVFFRWGWMG